MTYTEILSISAAVIITLVFLFFLTRRNSAAKVKKTNPTVVTALSAFFNGDDNKAIEQLRNVAFKGQANPEIYLILGFLQKKKGDYTRAAQIHEMMLGNPDIDKEFKNALYGELARDYMLAGQYAKAVALLKQENQIMNKPENIETMARSALALQSYDNAVSYYTKYNKTAGKNMVGFFEKCMVEKAVNAASTQNAMKYIKSALEANKSCRPARIIKALIYLHNDKVAKSVEEFKAIIDEGLLRDMNDFKNVEKAYIALGKESELHNLLREHSSSGSINPFIHIALADYYEYNNDSHSAKVLLESYIELPEAKIIAAKEYAARYNNKLLAHALKDTYYYKCRECGFETNEYKDDCPKCAAYDSIYPK